MLRRSFVCNVVTFFCFCCSAFRSCSFPESISVNFPALLRCADVCYIPGLFIVMTRAKCHVALRNGLVVVVGRARYCSLRTHGSAIVCLHCEVVQVCSALLQSLMFLSANRTSQGMLDAETFFWNREVHVCVWRARLRCPNDVAVMDYYDVGFSTGTEVRTSSVWGFYQSWENYNF